MAALDLHCGVDPGVCVWSGECVDSLDSFDSEVQLWEEQLQEVQRKIEELYKVVEARRGATEMNPNSNAHLDVTLLPVRNTSSYNNNGCRGGNVNNVPVQHKTSKPPSNHTSDPLSYGVNYHSSGFAGPQSYTVKGQDVLDILDGYLGMDSRENPHGAPNISSVQTQSVYTDQWPVTSRTGCVSLGEFEEVENRKNKVSVWNEPQVRRVSWKDQITEKSVSKPPIKQRDSPHVPIRHVNYSDSPKCPLVDRRCGSPSVLRKFGAMLQENEGKTLIEDGIVTTLVPKLVPMSPKPGGSRGSRHVTVKDTEAPVSLQNWEHRGAKVGVKTSHWGTDNLQTDFKMTERILGNCSTPSPRNTPSPHQASCDSSPTTPRRSFSRPARPANQRPPTRWASHAPPATISPLVIPRSRSLSPACKSKHRFNNYSLYTETVIM
ncbi:uncharacterized protein LOC113653004 [Tachysurus fulvidraco]|uniref:uncharacterized protein LOC113653004 n=1 Tax=Tachysurus fulvidraco TaxID=1234273 RepID=UPI001FEDC963|nr:uncharacterized protein LOC113653004 [Tachysurus fulvidraco]XP_027018168.2 uncharacterized protein LOC113653004 [Tachysurus fulvidraco]